MNLRVRNYQAAKDVNLLIEGLTVLKGQSNAGKSSVLKALYAATHNRFRRGCVSWDADSCIVQIRYTGEENILRVERSAMGASPRVALGTKTKGYKTFSKMNRDLPKEIQDYNNFGYIQVTPQEKLSLNFCTQFAPPLMVKFSNKRIVDILSYSKATADAAKAKKWLDEKQVYLKGEFSAMDSAISSTKEHLGELQKEDRKFKHYTQVQDHASEISYLTDDLEKFKNLLELLAERNFLNKKRLVASKSLSQAKEVFSQESAKTNLEALKQNLNLKAATQRKLAILDEARKETNFSELGVNKFKELLDLIKTQAALKAKVENSKRVLTQAEKACEAQARIIKLELVRHMLEQREQVAQDLKEAVHNREHMVCPICGTRITE